MTTTLPPPSPLPTDGAPITGDDLAAAVAAGVIDADVATALVRFAEDRRIASAGGLRADPQVDDEEVRFVSSFNDIFVTIGIVLLLGATGLFVGRLSTVAAAATAMVLIWGLSELFARRRRMALPGIVLVGSLVVAAGTFGAELADGMGAGIGTAGSLAGLCALGAGALHWWRFGVPISIAGAMAGAGLLVFALLGTMAPDFVAGHGAPLLLALGLAGFALAMRWDASDRERRTRRSDVAFWLHVLAAPAIVHALVFIASGTPLSSALPFFPAGAADPLVILVLYAGLAVVAVVIDRRALLVSGLVYFGIASGALIERAGWTAVSDGSGAAAVVGIVVLALALGWTPLRNRALALLPQRLRELVPPPRR